MRPAAALLGPPPVVDAAMLVFVPSVFLLDPFYGFTIGLFVSPVVHGLFLMKFINPPLTGWDGVPAPFHDVDWVCLKCVVFVNW